MTDDVLGQLQVHEDEMEDEIEREDEDHCFPGQTLSLLSLAILLFVQSSPPLLSPGLLSMDAVVDASEFICQLSRLPE